MKNFLKSVGVVVILVFVSSSAVAADDSANKFRYRPSGEFCVMTNSLASAAADDEESLPKALKVRVAKCNKYKAIYDQEKMSSGKDASNMKIGLFGL